MRCNELLETMNDYLDGNAGFTSCRRLREHLVDCVSCRIVVDNIRHTITLYRAGEEVSVPAKLHERIWLLMRDRWPVKNRVTDPMKERKDGQPSIPAGDVS